MPSGRIRYSCNPAIRTATPDISFHLANLLDTLSNREPHLLLEEIVNAINNKEFEEFYSPDNSPISDSIQLVPPNVVLNQLVTIELTDLKSLLEEWIQFCKS